MDDEVGGKVRAEVVLGGEIPNGLLPCRGCVGEVGEIVGHERPALEARSVVACRPNGLAVAAFTMYNSA